MVGNEIELIPVSATPRYSGILSIPEAARRSARDDRLAVVVEGEDGVTEGLISVPDLREAAQADDHGLLRDLCDPALVTFSEHEARTALLARPHLGASIYEHKGIETIAEVAAPPIRTAIVMAGGRGSRLHPLTANTPKPLLEVGGRVLLFRILDHLRDHGVTRLYLSVQHMADQIREAVGDGSDWGMETKYLHESEPLDTGAGLAMLERVDEPFFVINGDILTNFNFTVFGKWHRLRRSMVTIGTYRYPAPLPYGVLHRDGARVVEIEEKPVHKYDINAGIYAFSPTVLDHVPHQRPLAMVHFLDAHARKSTRVMSFPIIEYWNDVGTHADFERAQTEVHSL